MIAVGQKLPTEFTLKVLDAVGMRTVSFAELLTRRTIVSVYMRNNTPSCDRQNDALAAHVAEFDRAGFNLIALSRDTCGSHARYRLAKKISYVLASDPNDAFAKAADALVDKTMYGRKFRGPARAAFILDRDGTVLAVIDKVDSNDHATQLRDAIAKL